MKARIVMLTALALTPVAVRAHDDAQQQMMHGAAEGGHPGDGARAQAVGKPGDPNRVSRIVQVVMSDDMKFTPANLNVKRGEIIKFEIRNAGRIRHEMVIGSMAELKQHAAMMRKMPGMEHADRNQVTLAPGRSGDLVWQFTKAGTVDFACLEPGHFEAGMMGKVTVK